MRRIDTPTAAADLFGPGKPGFRDGDPALAILATRLNAAFFNALQEELASVVENAGLALNPADNTQLLQAIQLLQWAVQPVGVPVPVFGHLAGVVVPPKDKGYRYIKLTASDAYNAGVLVSESVSGSAPLIAATAVINLAGSPLNGQTVSLINTEKRVLRASDISGELLSDAMQGHHHGLLYPFTGGFGGELNTSLSTQASSGILANTATSPISDGVNGTPRVANETRAKSIGVTYYMRIK